MPSSFFLFCPDAEPRQAYAARAHEPNIGVTGQRSM